VPRPASAPSLFTRRFTVGRSGMLAFVLALVMIGAAASAPGAGAITFKDGKAFLPPQVRGPEGACLFVRPVVMTGVGTSHAKLTYLYQDFCAFPAKTSLEVRWGDEDWKQVEEVFTRTTYETLLTRDIRLGDLPRHTRISVRTRIDYLGETARTGSVSFKTDGDPARDLRATGKTPAVDHIGCNHCIYSVRLTATIPTTGNTVADAEWGRNGGYEKQQRFCATCGGSNVPMTCAEATENYRTCTWDFRWRLEYGEKKANERDFSLAQGYTYNLRLCLSNDIYEQEFGRQCTEQFEFKRVGEQEPSRQIDVGQSG
jgi:hypothetical protein